MKVSLILASVLLIGLVSCNQDEELLPTTTISGVYENAIFNPDLDFWYVNTYTFIQDGSFEQSSTVRETQKGPDLGFVSHSTGSYVLRGEEFRVTRQTMNRIESDLDEYYVSKTSLVPVSDFDPAELKGRLKMLEQGDKIALVFECNDILLGICLGELIYDRVRE